MRIITSSNYSLKNSGSSAPISSSSSSSSSSDNEKGSIGVTESIASSVSTAASAENIVPTVHADCTIATTIATTAATAACGVDVHSNESAIEPDDTGDCDCDWVPVAPVSVDTTNTTNTTNISTADIGTTQPPVESLSVSVPMPVVSDSESAAPTIVMNSQECQSCPGPSSNSNSNSSPNSPITSLHQPGTEPAPLPATGINPTPNIPKGPNGPIKVESCVLRLGLQNALTDHSAIFFDVCHSPLEVSESLPVTLPVSLSLPVDSTSTGTGTGRGRGTGEDVTTKSGDLGVILEGCTNKHWYQLGIQHNAVVKELLHVAYACKMGWVCRLVGSWLGLGSMSGLGSGVQASTNGQSSNSSVNSSASQRDHITKHPDVVDRNVNVTGERVPDMEEAMRIVKE